MVMTTLDELAQCSENETFVITTRKGTVAETATTLPDEIRSRKLIFRMAKAQNPSLDAITAKNPTTGTAIQSASTT